MTSKAKAFAERLRPLPGSVALLAALMAASLTPAAAGAADSCPNADYRWGPSAKLPDCRAYELVTPADTNGQSPFAGMGKHITMQPFNSATKELSTPSVSAGGSLFLYQLYGTALPEEGGTGYTSTYLAERSAGGWSSRLLSPDPTVIHAGIPGGASHDFQYMGFTAQQDHLIPMQWPNYSSWMRQPDGSFRPIGEGTVPADPDDDAFSNGFADDQYATPAYISPSGDHQVIWTFFDGTFVGSPVPLTAGVPSGVEAVYDRTSDGLHLVSVLPDGSIPTTNSWYRGASRDGSVIAFSVADPTDSAMHTLYVRIGNQTTKEIVTANFNASSFDNPAGFAGVTDEKLFYRIAGDLYAYDFVSEEETQITATGEARFVRVTEDGGRVFFLSNSQLDGASGVDGEPNLYVWDGSDVEFIATTRSEDTAVSFGGLYEVGIERWLSSDSSPVAPSGRWKANQNSTRATEDGGVFVFTSSADATGQNPGNFFQIYRWEAGTGELTCVSCPVDGGDTTAKTLLTEGSGFSGTAVDIPNLTKDGQTVFFESDQRLVAGDVDSVTSVYQWRDGELALLSSGDSSRSAHIVGATTDGSQVFINTTDKLVPDPQESGVPAVYSVRVNGGLPLPRPATPCAGDACLRDSKNGSAPPVASAGTKNHVGPGDATARSAGSIRVAGRVVGARLRVAVRVPGAGTIAVRGGRVNKARKRAGRPGRYVLTLRLTRKSVGLLKQRRKLRVALRVTFTPRAGVRSSKRLALTVRRPKAQRSHQASVTLGGRR